MKEKSFEENIENLENIVTELEKGNLNLDESMKKFEEGMKISRDCTKILEDAEKKITVLLDNDGEIKYRVTYVPTNSVLGIYDEVKQCGNLIAGKLNGRYITFCPTVNEKGEFDTGIIDVSEQVSLIEKLNGDVHATFIDAQHPRVKSRVYKYKELIKK